MQNLYQRLGLNRQADPAEIKAAYRKMARNLHPDVNQAPDAKVRFQAINEAYQILSDPLRRKLYDLGFSGRPSRPGPVRPREPQTRKPGTPYVSRKMRRQAYYLRYIPTIKHIAYACWAFSFLIVLDLLWTQPLQPERVLDWKWKLESGSERTQVTTEKRIYEGENFVSWNVQKGDLVQFERGILFRKLNYIRILEAFELPPALEIGKNYINRSFYGVMLFGVVALIFSMAAYFLPDKWSEFKFQLAIGLIFFFFIGILLMSLT